MQPLENLGEFFLGTTQAASPCPCRRSTGAILVQVHAEWVIFQASPEELPTIDILTLKRFLTPVCLRWILHVDRRKGTAGAVPYCGTDYSDATFTQSLASSGSAISISPSDVCSKGSGPRWTDSTRIARRAT